MLPFRFAGANLQVPDSSKSLTGREGHPNAAIHARFVEVQNHFGQRLLCTRFSYRSLSPAQAEATFTLSTDGGSARDGTRSRVAIQLFRPLLGTVAACSKPLRTRAREKGGLARSISFTLRQRGQDSREASLASLPVMGTEDGISGPLSAELLVSLGEPVAATHRRATLSRCSACRADQNPKYRMRVSPVGSTCNRYRLRNSLILISRGSQLPVERFFTLNVTRPC